MSGPKQEPTYDSVWKSLPHIVVLTLVGLVVQGLGATLTPWKTDIKVVFDRDLDNVFLVEVNGQRVLLFVEYQTYPDPLMPLRMFQYAASLKLIYYQQYQEDIPVLAVVVWANPGATPDPTYASMATETSGMLYSYHEIHLSKFDWQTVNPLLLVMAPFLHGFTQNDVETAADEIIAHAPPEHVRLLVGGLLIVTRRKFKRFKNFAAVEQAILQKVKTTMNFITQIILEDPDIARLIESKVAEGEAKGKAEGEAKGKAEGEAKGKAEGEAKGETKGWQGAVAAIWEDRFGTVPDDVVAAIAKLDMSALRPMMFLMTKATEAEGRLALGIKP